MPSATTVPPPAPARPSAPAGVGRFPGDVAPGYVRWGAAVSGNGDPVVRHEAPAGATMGLQRSYFSWDRRLTSMVTTARADIAAGRVPWVSTKTPPWADMAAGRYDGEIDSMLRALDNLGGPVWLTLHHEPEGGGGAVGPDDPGGPAAWRGMQVRLRQRMTAVGTKNIAFAPILMSWTFDPRSGRNPADWWVDGVWDFVGIDHYQENAAQPVETNEMWTKTYAFIAAKGMKIALGEWGNRGTDAAAAADMDPLLRPRRPLRRQRPAPGHRVRLLRLRPQQSERRVDPAGCAPDEVPPPDGPSHVAPGERDGVLTLLY